MDLDFRGRRVWMQGRPGNIFVVVRQMGTYRDGGRTVHEVYIRRPGVTQGPIVMLNVDAYPAGRP